MKNKHWQGLEVAPDKTHHTIDGQPAYDNRFFHVINFHEPGLAPAKNATGAFHIDVRGRPVYKHRYLRTFGFYDERAAVHSEKGWLHIFSDGEQVYSKRFSWCGNFQEKYSVVKGFDGTFFHIDSHGERTYLQSFSYVGDFRDGIAVVQNSKGEYTHINVNGEFIHSKWFFDLDVYHKGFARAKDERGWFHLDQRGYPIYKERYQNIEPYYNGVARVETDMGAILLINEEGQEIQKLREPLKDPFHQASGELVSFWRFYAIQSAIELNVFDYMPISSKDLQKKLFLPHSILERFMRALQEMELIEKVEENRWAPSPKGVFFQANHPHSLKGAARLWKKEHMESWKKLSYSLKTGCPAFDKFYGARWFDWLKKNPEEDRLYHDVLSIYAKRDYLKISQQLDLSKHQSIIDIGGGKGVLLSHLLEKNTHLTGFLFDLPNVLKQAVIPKSLAARMKCVSGNFFETWPVFSVDSAILSRVLHDWAEEEVVQILRKLRLALTDCIDNRVYIIENILNETNSNGGLLDLNMLVMTGGAERTLDQFEQLLNQSGFILETVLPLNQVSSILIAKKNITKEKYNGISNI